MSGALAIDASAWAYGPEGREAVKDRLQPFWLVAGLLAAIGVAGVLGFVAFVTFAGSDDGPSSALPSARIETQGLEPLDAPEPFQITNLRLTDAVDAATGEPAGSARTFGLGEPVQLWLSFEAGDSTDSLTAVWFRGEKKVARLTAPLPDAASQMVFPLPEVAADQPGSYRVEVRSASYVLAAESFEVTDE